jgi:hypothetical protein
MIRSTLALLAVLAAAPAVAEEFTYGASAKQIRFCDNRNDIMERAWDYREMDIKFHERTAMIDPTYTLIYIDSWTYPTMADGETDVEKKWHRDHWMTSARFSCLTGKYGS